MSEITGDGASQAMVYEGGPVTGGSGTEKGARSSNPRVSRPQRRTSAVTADSPSAVGAGETSELRRNLRDFASGRPQGWNHEDWIVFLEGLKNGGYDIRDRDAIGVALERERLDLVLSNVRGLGPRRREALVDRYGTVWTLRAADPHEIAQVARIPTDLARKAREATI